jgi:hypothetical protein
MLAKLGYTIGSYKITLPPPQECPHCRYERRACWRNDYTVNQHASSLSGNKIFSSFFEPLPFPVYSNTEWWSDGWDALDYGLPYDRTTPFLSQWLKLQTAVPHPACSTLNMENSDFCNNAGELKNCYLVFNANGSEDCMTSYGAQYSKDCIDCYQIHHCELCFECVGCERCYNVQSSRFSSDCTDSYFLENCRSCSHCYGCSNLVRASYCIFNQQVTPQEYAAYIQGLNLTSRSAREKLALQFKDSLKNVPCPSFYGTNVEQAHGNFINNSKEIYHSFLINKSESCRYCYCFIDNAKYCLDVTLFGVGLEYSYESAVCGANANGLLFCNDCWDGCENLIYCEMCPGSSHCFGCVGLRKKSYCILNKQYSKEQYETLVPEIIEAMKREGSWGRFFPAEYSPFPLNITLGYLTKRKTSPLPATQQEAEARGFAWNVKNTPHQVTTIEIPDTITDTEHSLTVRSRASGKPFKITVQELRARKKLGVPPPELTYEERLTLFRPPYDSFEFHTHTCSLTGVQLSSSVTLDERPIAEHHALVKLMRDG